MIGSKTRRIALAIAMAAMPMASQAETLADALAGAYEHSGLLRQNQALLRAADENVAVAVAALRPILNWSSSVSRSFGQNVSTSGTRTGFQNDNANFSVAAQLLLYDFDATRLRLDAAKESVLSARESLRGVEQQILLRALQAYVNVQLASETVGLRQNNQRLVQQELRAARDRFEVGEVTRTDVALAESRLASSRASLAAAQGALLSAGEEFRAAVGRKPSGLRPIGKLPALEQNEEQAKAIALRNHPDMLRAQYDVNVAEISVRRALAAMKPTFSLSGQVAQSADLQSQANSTTGTVSLSASGPIYRGGQLYALERQARANADASRANLHIVRHAISQQVGNALSSFRVANASIEATQNQIRAARVAFRGVREEASLGQRTTLDVLTAEQDLLDAETAYTSAVADRTIAAYSLLSAMGLMTAKHLGLNVQQYDPAEYYRLVKNAPPKSLQGDKLDRVLRRIGQ